MQKQDALAGLYKLNIAERRQRLTEYADLSETDLAALDHGLSMTEADAMIENVVGRYSLPLGVATNFLINDRDYAVPMVVEEPSIVAAVSYAAKLVRHNGGFKTGSSDPVMIGQIQILDLDDLKKASEQLLAAKEDILGAANRYHPTIQRLGGGAQDIECRSLMETPAGPMLVLHILYDSRDAMGANAVNTAVEAVAPLVAQITGGRVNLKILSNLTDRRLAWAECTIAAESLTRGELDGQQVARHIFEAWAFAFSDPYRAATHNKGIMNGIDAVAVATGNDWRALEAGAHAYAARNGRYGSLSDWSILTARDGSITHLRGQLKMPLSVGTVGGATRTHPTARTAMKILENPGARNLA